MDGLFWISIFGLGFVIGNTLLLTKFGVWDLIVLGYAVLSTIVCLINFGFSMWGALSIMRAKDGKLTMRPGHETRQLGPPKLDSMPIPATSVTENTTRSFEPLERN